MDVIHNGTIPSGSITMTHEVALVRYWIPRYSRPGGVIPQDMLALELGVSLM